MSPPILKSNRNDRFRFLYCRLLLKPPINFGSRFPIWYVVKLSLVGIPVFSSRITRPSSVRDHFDPDIAIKSPPLKDAAFAFPTCTSVTYQIPTAGSRLSPVPFLLVIFSVDSVTRSLFTIRFPVRESFIPLL